MSSWCISVSSVFGISLEGSVFTDTDFCTGMVARRSRFGIFSFGVLNLDIMEVTGVGSVFCGASVDTSAVGSSVILAVTVGRGNVSTTGSSGLIPRIMFCSINKSFGPPIKTKCSTLSRRTITSLRP